MTTTQLPSHEVMAECYRLLGFKVERRYISADPACGGWDEIQSVFENEPDKDEHLSGRPTGWCYLRPNPYAEQPYTDDDYIWEVVPEDDDLFAAFELQAEIERHGLAKWYIEALAADLNITPATLQAHSAHALWAVANATAEQRAWAALKALWEAK